MDPRPPARHPQRILALALAATAAVMGLALARSKHAGGENVHRMDGNCQVCHTADAAALNKDPAHAKVALAANLEATCNRCHGAQGPSHKTNVALKKAAPAGLPLASDGKIACATCHFMHGENNQFGDFLRIDNRRGKLCLSCHTMAELSK